MTQRTNQSTIIRAGENPYLERIMRLIAVGVSVAVTFFTFAGILGVTGGTNDQLETSQNGGLIRIESAIQAKLDRYSTDLISLRNDQNLIDHLTGSENVRTASARAGEIIALHLNEYERIQFIEIRDGQAFLAFDRVNNNNSVSDVIPYETLAYTAPTQSQSAFTSVLNGTEQSIVLSDFYLRTDGDGRTNTNNVVLLDAYIPVYIGAEPAMIINLQINATELRNIVNLAVGELVDGAGDADSRRVLWLVGTDSIVADSDSIGTNYIENLNSAEGNVDGDAFYEALLTVDGLLLGTTEPIQDFPLNTIYASRLVQYETLPDLSWRIVITDNLLVYYTSTIVASIGIGTLALLISVVVVVVIKQILRPMLQQVYEADTLIQTSVRDSHVAVRSVGDQAELVAAARRVSTRMNRLSEDLEKETQRRNRDMQVAGRIGRETATLTNLDTLAATTINLICNEFGFYHAQIFLLDQSRTNAVLRYSRGDAGNELIQRGHQLRVGSDSVVGAVAIEKQPVIVNDTQENSEAHEVNPLLADTRAEMGLPLLIGDTIIGILDIQSRYAHSFLKEDISTYQLVADQLAVGIYNAQLRVQTEQRIIQIDSLNRQLTRDAWSELEEKLELRKDYGTQINDAKLATNISIRGEVIGSFEASLPEGQQFSEADRQILSSVTERVSLALENARLFQETQTSLSETSILYQLSRLLNEADDLEDVLQAIIVSVAATASGGQVWLFDDTLPSQKPDWARATIDIAIKERDNRTLLIDRRLQLSQYPFMERLSGDTTVAVEDLDKVEILDDLRRMFSSVNAVALVFIPLNIRGLWKGFMSITFAETQVFSARDQRIYDALIAQAGVAIDNRLLLQQTEVALERQEKLYAASRIINTSQSLSDLVFATVATASNPDLNFWLGLLNNEGDEEGWTQTVEVIAKSQNGEVEEVLEIHPVFSPENSPMRRREPEILVDPGEDIQDVPEPVQWMRSLGYNFVAMFPLFSDNTPIAIFYIVSESPYDLSQDDYEVYRALTGQMSTQIQNRSLFSQTEQTLSEIRRLYVATRAISGAQDTSAIYDAVAGHIAMPFIQQSARLEQDLNVSITVLLANPQPDIYAPQLRYDYVWHSDPNHNDDDIIGRIISQEDAPFGSLIADNDDGALVYKTLEDAPKDFPMIAEILGANGATSAIAAPLWSRLRWFGILILRTDQAHLLDEDYQRFVQSISDQVAIALENQQLLAETQFERQRLSEILATLPVGVMVLDYTTFEPISTNQQVEQLLGQVVHFDEPFNSEMYNLYRTGTDLIYPDSEMPIYVARQTGQEVMPVDDIAVVYDGGQTDLLMSAAPIFDSAGVPHAIVVAFQDISTLRSMESTIQENLRETILLYETQRTLNEASTLDELLDSLIMQLAMQQTSDAIILLNQDNGSVVIGRSLMQIIDNANALSPLLHDDMVNISNVEQDKSLDEDLKQSILNLGAQSILVMPLKARNRDVPLGWLVMVENRSDAFNFEQERLMSSIADMTSQALDNNYLFESTQSALQATEYLYNANTAISQARGNEDLFKEIEKLLDVLQPDMSAGYLLNGQNVEPMFKNGFEEIEADGYELDKLMALPLPRQEGLYVADITRNTLNSFELEVIQAGNITAFAAINLNVKNIPRGRLLVAYKEIRDFDTSDERYLRAIADSASIVIDNQLLLSQVQETLQETSILYQASKALIETTEPREIVDVIVTYLIEPHVNQVFIALLNGASWNAPSATVEVVATWQNGTDIDLLGVELSSDEFPAWTQLSTHSALTINDLYDENLAIDELEKMSIDTMNIRSLAILPLRVPGRDIGAVWIGSSEAYDYTDRDLRIFQSFAEQTSLSLEAKRLLEQTEERARQLQTSAVISQSIGQILDLDILLPQVVDLIREQFNYDHVQVFLMDTENDWALLRASTGDAGRELLGINHRLQRGSASVIGQVTEQGEPKIALDTADAKVVHKPNPYLPLTRSEIALPMIVKGEIVGALDVQSNRPNAFSEDDLQVLTTLAAQIAVAIDNARLYEDVEQSAEDMSFLFDLTTTAAAAQTLNEALDNVAHQIKDNVRSEVVAIYLTQDYEDYYGNRKKMIEANAVASNNDIHIDNLISVEIGEAENTLAFVASNLQPQIIVNIDRDVRYQPIHGTSKSAVLVPITSRADLVGIIVIESNHLNVYTNETVVLIQTLAGSLAAVIQNTLLVEQLQTSNEQLREVDRLKSQFLASMSHELRTPLNSIIGFSRVMLKGIDGPLSEMQEQDLTTIYNSGNHLLRLINDILDQAKIEANEINLKFGYFDIKPVVESVKSIAIGLMKEKPNLRLNIQIADGLPKAYGDEFRSRQILLNLVTNAIKFTQEGSVTLDVYAIENEPAPLLIVDVIDTGLGIEASNLGTVFEQFRQVDNSLTRTVGGTGLGLPISKSFSELQGGNLTVASEVGVGSTFSVTIPTYEGAEEALESLREEQRSGQKAVSAQSPSSTASGLISKSDVEKAKRLANMKHEPNANGTNEINKVDTQEFQKQKYHAGRIDANVTQNIPLMTQKRDVILVEDDKTMVDQFRRILQREGFEVSTADFAAFAEAMIGQLRPNVVILDVNFADGVGWDLLKNLKERDDTFDIPVVVTTIDEDSERAYRLGAHSFIQRPFLPEDVLEAVLEAEKESNHERILIIDDQEDTIRLLTHLLEEHSDFKIYSAKSGDEGISLVARRRPDLIILDLRMPGKDGFAVLDELRGNPETAKIPVLVVTGEMDLNNSEQEQLVDIHVLQKTDISQEEYDLFIENVRSYLQTNNRK